MTDKEIQKELRRIRKLLRAMFQVLGLHT